MPKIHYLDLINGSLDGDGLTYATRRRLTVDENNLEPGDEVRVMQSPNPENTGLNATWDLGEKHITISSSVFKHLYVGSWSNGFGLTEDDASRGKTDLPAKRFSVPSSISGKLAYITFASVQNLVAYTRIQFWLRSELTLAADDIVIELCSDVSGNTVLATIEVPALPTTYRWTPIVIETGALPSNVRSISIRLLNAKTSAFAIYLDNMSAILPESSGGFTFHDLLGKPNSFGAGGDDSDTWYAISGIINDTQVLLDTYAESTKDQRLGYCGESETVGLFRRRCVLPDLVETDNAIYMSIPTNGIADHPISWTFGWNSDGMTVQNSSTWIDGRNGAGTGIAISGRSWVDLNNVSLVRFNYGILGSAVNRCDLSIIAVSHNTNHGILFDGTSARNTIGILFGNRGGRTAFSDHVLGGNNVLTIGKINSNLSYGIEVSHNDVVKGGLFQYNNRSAIHTAGTVKIYDVTTDANSAGVIVTPSAGIYFDGVDDYLVLETEVNNPISDTATVTFWIKTTQTGTGTTWLNPTVLGVEAFPNQDDVFYGNMNDDGRISINVGDYIIAKSTNPINNDQWHHVAFSRNRSTGQCKCWINGVLNETGTGTTTDITEPIINIARLVAGPNGYRFFRGSLDDLRIYNRLLSDVEVGKVAQAFTGSEDVTDGLVHQWTFDEGTGIIAEDSVNGNTATLINGAAWVDGISTSGGVGETTTTPGLLATYFNGLDFTGETYSRIDPNITFVWDTTPPAPGFGITNWTARWEGYVKPLYTEPYTFYTSSDDGARVWVNGVLLIDNWVTQEEVETASATINLVAGQRYQIKVEYLQTVYGGARIHFRWSSPSQAKEVIPDTQLSHGFESGVAAIWINSSCSTGYTVYLYDCLLNEEHDFGGYLDHHDTRIASHHHNRVKGSHQIVTDGGRITNETGSDRRTASGYAWKMMASLPRSEDYPLDLKLASIACVANRPVTISGWFKRQSDDVVAQLVIPGGQIDGVNTDLVATAVASSGSYEQLSLTFTPVEQGVIDIYGRTYGGNGDAIWIDDMSAVQA